MPPTPNMRLAYQTYVWTSTLTQNLLLSAPHPSPLPEGEREICFSQPDACRRAYSNSLFPVPFRRLDRLPLTGRQQMTAVSRKSPTRPLASIPQPPGGTNVISTSRNDRRSLSSPDRRLPRRTGRRRRPGVPMRSLPVSLAANSLARPSLAASEGRGEIAADVPDLTRFPQRAA